MTMYNYDTLLPLGVKEPRELRRYLWDRVSKAKGRANLRPSERRELDRITRKILWPPDYHFGCMGDADFAVLEARLIAEGAQVVHGGDFIHGPRVQPNWVQRAWDTIKRYSV